jgi:hypothetical protein
MNSTKAKRMFKIAHRQLLEKLIKPLSYRYNARIDLAAYHSNPGPVGTASVQRWKSNQLDRPARPRDIPGLNKLAAA